MAAAAEKKKRGFPFVSGFAATRELNRQLMSLLPCCSQHLSQRSVYNVIHIGSCRRKMLFFFSIKFYRGIDALNKMKKKIFHKLIKHIKEWILKKLAIVWDPPLPRHWDLGKKKNSSGRKLQTAFTCTRVCVLCSQIWTFSSKKKKK